MKALVIKGGKCQRDKELSYSFCCLCEDELIIAGRKGIVANVEKIGGPLILAKGNGKLLIGEVNLSVTICNQNVLRVAVWK